MSTHNGSFKKGDIPWNKGKRSKTDKQIKEDRRKYNLENKEKLSESKKRWKISNYKKVLESNRKSYKRIGRSAKLKKNYGIDIDEYNLLLERQNHKCAICQKEKTESDRTFCVDHNHDNGIIRGILCRNCNSGIGLLQDSADIILKALIYIKQ